MNNTNMLGLSITPNCLVRKVRRLPLPGDVLVKVGDTVSPETQIAYGEVPGYSVPVNIANKLALEAHQVEPVIIKRVGDTVKKGEALASIKTFFGLGQQIVPSPIDGTIESLSPHTGVVVLRSHPAPFWTYAHIHGRVAELIPHEGAVIETTAAFVQGIMGVGGERHGLLHVAVGSPAEVLDSDRITADMAGKIIVGGSLVTLGALQKAQRLGVVGIITGGINDIELGDFLGFDIGLAITGQENISLSVIITEGIGQIAMSDKTFSLLSSLQGNTASINGTTHIRSGVIHPEIIVPSDLDTPDESQAGTTALQVGANVRIIRNPHFGKAGRIVALPDDLHLAPSELMYKVALLELDDGEQIALPLANLVLI
ncbi:MAG: hypothetical protein KGZ53_06645 [Peptococcaceae bacterium]|nr:hypothetical protein [Peptococcaceae bacterium]MBS3950322.1 hypothetical protein [Peptococcaceae bacterium]